jgi:hypothetical protein
MAHKGMKSNKKENWILNWTIIIKGNTFKITILISIKPIISAKL